MNRVVIDQSKILIDEDLVTSGAHPFPRPMTWWNKTLPIWVTAMEAADGKVILEPNGKVADGSRIDLTPAQMRRKVKAIRKYLEGRLYLDFSDAIVED